VFSVEKAQVKTLFLKVEEICWVYKQLDDPAQ